MSSPLLLRSLLCRGLVALGLVCAIPATAFAEDGAALFAEGRKAMAAGDLDRACSLFDESFRLDAKVSPLLNLAECESRRGHHVEAIGHWRKSLELLAPDDPRREIATKGLADNTAHAASITLSWVGAPPDARVSIDGVAATLGASPVLVNPGDHVVVVEGPERRTLTVSLAAGEKKTVELAVAEKKEDAGFGPMGIAGFVTIGAAGLALIGVATTGGLYMKEKAAVDEGCPSRACTTTEAFEAGERGRVLAFANLGLIVGAAVLGGVGTTLVVLDTSGRDEPSEAARVELRLGLGGVGLGGTF